MEDQNDRPALRPAVAASSGAQAVLRGSGASLSELITLQWHAERGELDLQNFLLAVYFVRLTTLVQRADERECQQQFGISAGDMRLMLALRRSGPPYVKRPTDLFRTLLVTSGAITKKVDRLVASGYVERLPDPGHSGGFLVHLTKKGLRAVDQRVEYLAEHSVLGPAMEQFTPEERRRGIEFVLKTLAVLESADVPGDDEEPAEKPRAAAKRSKR
jgi:DNA-binding MarR family transcriptional regulator